MARWLWAALLAFVWAAMAPGAIGQDGRAPRRPGPGFVPDGATPIRAVIVGQGGRSDPAMQEFCGRHRVAVAESVESLRALAQNSKHPEIEIAPLIPIGNSAGALAATETALKHIDRVLAVIPLHGAMLAKGNDAFNANRSGDTPGDIQVLDVDRLLGVPMFLTFVDGDGFVSPVTQEGFVHYGRRKGAPWAFLAGAGGNHTDSSQEFAKVLFPWLAAVMERRLGRGSGLSPLDEKQGWLGDLRSKEIAPYQAFKGDRAKANWFPDEEAAKAWKGWAVIPPYGIPDQASPAKPSAIGALRILDPKNHAVSADPLARAAWRVNADFKEADQLYNDIKYFALGPVPPALAGADWIRPIIRGKNTAESTADPLMEFKVEVDAVVCVALDERLTASPAWLAGWVETKDPLRVCRGRFKEALGFRVYTKRVTAGSKVTLGSNGGQPRGGACMYLVFAKSATPRSTGK